MGKFEEERKEYLKKLHKLRYTVDFCGEIDSEEVERIISEPKNELELIKANAYLDITADLASLPENGILGRIKNAQGKKNIFVEYAVLVVQAINSSNSGNKLREEMLKMAASKGQSDIEYMAELMFYAVVTPFVDDEALANILQDERGSDLSDELSILTYTAILKKIHEEMLRMEPNSADNLLAYTRHFHNVCTEHTIVKEDSPADAIMRRILKTF